MSPKDQISKAEIRKDALQDTVEATATAVGAVTTIVTGAVRDIARAVGGFATEVFEIRDSARRAAADAETSGAETSGAPEEPPGEGPPATD
jgi:hypothetical protein